MKAKCWLIGNPDGRFPFQAERAARMRGLAVECFPACEGEMPRFPGHKRTLIAVRFDRIQRMSPAERRRLSESVLGGATLYIRGGLSPGARFNLDPFASGVAEIARETSTLCYRFTLQPLLPGVLRGEHAEGDFRIPVAHGLNQAAMPMLVARDDNGLLWPSLFAIEHGAGMVICDLHEDDAESQSLMRMLENPARLPAAIGAVVAADRAAGLNPARSVPFNIVIDDRPANLDYFNVAGLRTFLDHLEQQCPGVHVDFAWTPDQSHPSRRYIETLKEFNTGFVWHGLLHHVDHRNVKDPESDFALGRRLVTDISRRYGVDFQPVMIFPFEKANARSVAVLKREGFIAKAETPDDPAAIDLPEKEDESDSGARGSAGNFATLIRHAVEMLSRERMLARAALGLPIIAAAHPKDVALKRLAYFRRDAGSVDYFDRVAEFAAEKNLRPESLQKIAEEMIAARGVVAG